MTKIKKTKGKNEKIQAKSKGISMTKVEKDKGENKKIQAKDERKVEV